MKVAISLPDELSHAIDARARALKVSRSGLLARAAREFIAKQMPEQNATDAWDRAVAAGGQPESDPAAAAFQRRSKVVVRESIRSKR